jgi:hypothetical protein
MTKLSHGCGWCFLPAVWAGEAALKFIVDIIIQNYPLYSDWLTELPNIFGLPGSGETSPDGWLGAWERATEVVVALKGNLGNSPTNNRYWLR